MGAPADASALPRPPASLAVRVIVRRYGVWNGAVLAVAAAAVASAMAWMAGFDPAPGVGSWAAAVLLAVVGAAGAFAAWRREPLSLRWDGMQWHLGPPDSAGNEPLVGRLTVAIDLGAWLMLEFTPESGGGAASRLRLPVQRRGLEPVWHALRCAVYSPAPNLATDAFSGERPPPHE